MTLPASFSADCFIGKGERIDDEVLVTCTLRSLCGHRQDSMAVVGEGRW